MSPVTYETCGKQVNPKNYSRHKKTHVKEDLICPICPEKFTGQILNDLEGNLLQTKNKSIRYYTLIKMYENKMFSSKKKSTNTIKLFIMYK